MIARRTRTGRLCAWVLGLSAVIAAATIASPASAQMGFGGWGESMTPDFTRRDVQLMVDGLRLDETQRLILETLYDSYEDDFSAKSDEFRDRLNAMREDMRPDEEREAAFRATREKFEVMRAEVRTQREALEAQHNGEIPEEVEEQFREEVRAKFETMRNEMREQSRDWFTDATAQDMFGKMAPITEEWLRAKNHLRDQFIGDLNAQLTDEQIELWPGVERLLRRTKSLQRGRISGESADLFQIVRSLNLEAEQQAAVDPVLSQYEIELDAALKQRDEYLESSRIELLKAMQTMATEDGLAVIEKQTKLRTQVRDVNDRFAANIEAALAEPLNAKFKEEFHVRAYPRVFEPTRTQRVFAAAKGLEGLDPTVAEAIATMSAAYDVEVTTKNESLLESVRKYEPEDAVRMSRRMAARFTGQEVTEEPDPLREAMQERGQIGERYLAQLTGVLTEDQVALLPMPGEDDDRRGRWAGEGPRGDWRGGQGGGGQREWRRGGDDDDDDRPRRRGGGDQPAEPASNEPTEN